MRPQDKLDRQSPKGIECKCLHNDTKGGRSLKPMVR